MANIQASLKGWSTTEASNQPDSTDATTLVGDLRAIQAGVRYHFSQDTIASAATTDLGSKEAGYLSISGTTTITAFGTVSAGIRKYIKFDGALTLTHNGTSLILPTAANITTAAGDVALMESLGSGNWRCLYYQRSSGAALVGVQDGEVTTAKLADGVFNGLTSVSPALGDSLAAADASDSGNKKKVEIADILGLLRGYLSGLTLSTAGSSATMSIAAGVATDSTSAELIQLSSAISKTTSSWAVGTAQGGLDTGAIANSTWYHFYLIRRPDTGVVDVVFSTNASTPTLPTNYTQYRRIGSGLTNGSGQWVKFTQVGDDFLWDAAVVDVDAVNPGTSAVSRTLTVPTGVKVDAMLSVGGYNGTQFFNIAISSLDSSDQAPQASGTAALSGFSTNNVPAGTTGWTFSTFNVRTNTSAQVRSRISASGAADRLGIITRGWVDTRGRLD